MQRITKRSHWIAPLVVTALLVAGFAQLYPWPMGARFWAALAWNGHLCLDVPLATKTEEATWRVNCGGAFYAVSMRDPCEDESIIPMNDFTVSVISESVQN